ncbi:hypothetical protein [Janthinobacterium sp. UMAB-56]|uniref:hypothetical protein n=1 Tax=Janthinobacterium sp. UMAB-56 TaxID=1365361 RepID=UPI001C55F6DF|nr:hypothetical protein [Janthinobacterium sp. UMAB-56]
MESRSTTRPGLPNPRSTRRSIGFFPISGKLKALCIVAMPLAPSADGIALASPHASSVTTPSASNAWGGARTGLLFLLASATLDAGRAALAVDRRRTSAIKAWWRGLGMLRRRPLACLAIYLVITLLGLTLYALLGVARLKLAAPGPQASVAGLLVTQLAALVLAWMRSARLFALIDVKRSLG